MKRRTAWKISLVLVVVVLFCVFLYASRNRTSAKIEIVNQSAIVHLKNPSSASFNYFFVVEELQGGKWEDAPEQPPDSRMANGLSPNHNADLEIPITHGDKRQRRVRLVMQRAEATPLDRMLLWIDKRAKTSFADFGARTFYSPEF